MNRHGDDKLNFRHVEVETSRWRPLVGSSVHVSGTQRKIKAGDRDLLPTSGHKLTAHGLILPKCYLLFNKKIVP